MFTEIFSFFLIPLFLLQEKIIILLLSVLVNSWVGQLAAAPVLSPVGHGTWRKPQNCFNTVFAYLRKSSLCWTCFLEGANSQILQQTECKSDLNFRHAKQWICGIATYWVWGVFLPVWVNLGEITCCIRTKQGLRHCDIKYYGLKFLFAWQLNYIYKIDA